MGWQNDDAIEKLKYPMQEYLKDSNDPSVWPTALSSPKTGSAVGTRTYADIFTEEGRRFYVITEALTPNFRFEGRTPVSVTTLATPSEASAIWQIRRIYTSGKITRQEVADSGNFNQVWDDRATLFPAPSLTNAFSILFDGINDSLEFGDVFLFDRTNQWSWSMWVKPNNIAARYTLYSKTTNDANVYGWVWYIEATSGVIFTQVRTASTLRSFTFSLPVAAASWNHVAMTYDGGSNLDGMRVYINGNVDTTPTSQSLAGTLLVNQTSMLARRNTAFEYPGNIDEFTVWDTALSPAHITELYNAGSPTDPTTHSQSGNLVNYYTMGDGDTFPVIGDNVGTDDGTMINMTASDIVADVP